MKDVLSMVMPGADCVSSLSPTPVGVRAHRPGSYTHMETLVNTYCNSLSFIVSTSKSGAVPAAVLGAHAVPRLLAEPLRGGEPASSS